MDNEEQFYKDSEEAGKVVGSKLRQSVKPLFDSVKGYLKERMDEQKELKEIERQAYMKQMKKEAFRRGRIKAEQTSGTARKSSSNNHPIRLNIMEDGYYD